MTERDFTRAIDRAVKDFSGDLTTLESAIGMFIVGRKMGWKVMLLVHDKKTIRHYEKILGLSVRDELPEVGPWAHKSVAWKLVQKVSNFWKAVKGEIPGIRTPEISKN